MNIRIAIAALLCAFYLGNSHAEPMKVDGENCLIPDASYVHVGVMNDSDRFYWLWCATRFDVFWSMSLDPVDRTADGQIIVGDAKDQARSSFVVKTPPIGWGEPATAELEQAARNAAAADSHRPPVPRWTVQKNGKSKTRPGYTITDGKRSTTPAAERAPVGADCDCRNPTSRSVEGRSVYCIVPIAVTPLLGSLCTPAPPVADPPAPEPPTQPPVVTPPVLFPPATPPGTGIPTAAKRTPT